MPSKSKKQHNLMAMVAHDPAAAKRLGIPQSVGKEFTSADKGKKFKGGGMAESKKAMEQRHARTLSKLAKEEAQEAKEYKKGGSVMKEKMGPSTMAKDVEAGSNKLTKFGESAVQKRGKTRGMNLGDSGPTKGIMGGMCKGGKVKKMASGGSVSSRADGIATKGKTRGKFC